MESIISQAQSIGRVVVQDKGQFEQSKCNQCWGLQQKGSPVSPGGLATLLLLKALNENTLSPRAKSSEAIKQKD